MWIVYIPQSFRGMCVCLFACMCMKEIFGFKVPKKAHTICGMNLMEWASHNVHTLNFIKMGQKQTLIVIAKWTFKISIYLLYVCDQNRFLFFSVVIWVERNSGKNWHLFIHNHDKYNGFLILCQSNFDGCNILGGLRDEMY